MRLFLIVIISIPLKCWTFPEWIPLTDQQNKICSQKKPCILNHEKSKKRYEIIFDLSTDGKKLSLIGVKIGLKNQKMQSFTKFKNFQRHYEGEIYGLFAGDINSDGFMDLFLEASHSARLGPFYFYFIFNPQTKNFVLTPEQIEKLDLRSNGNLMGSGSGQSFKIDSNFQITPK